MSETLIREPTPFDAAAITAVVNEHSKRLYSEPAIDEDEVRHWFTMPNIWIRVAERAGKLVGYVDVTEDHEAGTRFNIDARPLDAPAARSLVAAAEHHAREGAVAGAVARGFVSAVDEAAIGAFEPAGYRLIRHSFEMRIELDGAPPAPDWPDGMSVRTFRPADEQRVFDAGSEAFQDHWDYRPPRMDEWRRWGLENPRFDPELWFLAEQDGELAGVCLCNWNRSGEEGFGWVETLGVRRLWRRRGLGLALLRHSFREFQRRDATRVALSVDAENTTGAVRLYERAGMHVRRRSDTYEKAL